MSEPKKLIIKNNSFKANGKTYLVAKSLSAGSYEWLEYYRAKAQYGEKYGQFMQMTKDCRKALNEMRFADGCNILKNMEDLAEDQQKRAGHPLLMAGTLFVYEKDSDERWTEEQGRKILDDIIEENYDVKDFFLLVGKWINNFSQGLQTVFQNTSQSAKKNGKKDKLLQPSK